MAKRSVSHLKVTSAAKDYQNPGGLAARENHVSNALGIVSVVVSGLDKGVAFCPYELSSALTVAKGFLEEALESEAAS